MKQAKLVLPFVTILLLLWTVTASAQSADVNPSSPAVAKFPVVQLGPQQAEFNQNVKDVLFDYEDHIVDTQAEQDAVHSDAEWLKAHPDARFYIDGYADERGDIRYNMTLSQKRAEAVKAALLALGVPEDRILITVGFGKLYPICAEQAEGCWKDNRRVHLVYVPPSFDANTVDASAK
jgi:peptidoglycan-associated lipoprotein